MFTVNIKNTASVRQRMRKREESLKNKRIVFTKAIIQLDAWVQRNFEVEGALHEDKKLKWQPLHPLTLNKRRKGEKTEHKIKILQDTGRLKISWEHQVNKDSATLKSRVIYGETHEKGGFSKIEGKKIKVPQRKILPTVKQGTKLVLPVFQAFVKDLVK